MKREKLHVQTISQSCSAMFQPHEFLKPEKTKFPKMITFMLTSKNSQRFWFVKIVIGQTGKHPFSSFDGIGHIKLIDNKSG
jgi:hypothetical protein